MCLVRRHVFYTQSAFNSIVSLFSLFGHFSETIPQQFTYSIHYCILGNYEFARKRNNHWSTKSKAITLERLKMFIEESVY